MARKKTITKDQILNAAYEVVTAEGFSRFTARNIANKMDCSTQPIYLEFKNMDDLKRALLERIYQHLENDIYPEEHTGKPIVDLALNYIQFANKEKKLYRSINSVKRGYCQSVEITNLEQCSYTEETLLTLRKNIRKGREG